MNEHLMEKAPNPSFQEYENYFEHTFRNISDEFNTTTIATNQSSKVGESFIHDTLSLGKENIGCCYSKKGVLLLHIQDSAASSITNLRVKINGASSSQEIIEAKSPLWDEEKNTYSCNIDYSQKKLKSCIAEIEYENHVGTYSSSININLANVLVVGRIGSGKSTLIQSMKDSYESGKISIKKNIQSTTSIDKNSLDTNIGLVRYIELPGIQGDKHKEFKKEFNDYFSKHNPLAVLIVAKIGEKHTDSEMDAIQHVITTTKNSKSLCPFKFVFTAYNTCDANKEKLVEDFLARCGCPKNAEIINRVECGLKINGETAIKSSGIKELQSCVYEECIDLHSKPRDDSSFNTTTYAAIGVAVLVSLTWILRRR